MRFGYNIHYNRLSSRMGGVLRLKTPNAETAVHELDRIVHQLKHLTNQFISVPRDESCALGLQIQCVLLLLSGYGTIEEGWQFSGNGFSSGKTAWLSDEPVCERH